MKIDLVVHAVVLHIQIDDYRQGALNKVLAKIYISTGQGYAVHYITHRLDTVAFAPQSQFTNERINDEWLSILTSVKQQWEKGYTDIYAMIKIERDNSQTHFVLKTDDNNLPPMDHEQGVPLDYRMDRP